MMEGACLARRCRAACSTTCSAARRRASKLTAEKMEDPELRKAVRRQMVDAFDNRREDEVDLMFARLWHAGPIKTVKKLVEAVLDAQDVTGPTPMICSPTNG